jgi:hypothetical protein
MKKLVMILGVLALSASLFAQGQGKGKGKGRGAGNSGESAVAIFGDSDRRIIDEWVREAPPSGLPPGLAKRGDLPPGLQKQLRKNGTLPPGLQKKVSPFPVELSRRLTPLPADCGCDRVFLDGKAMIIARATSAILDVIRLF